MRILILCRPKTSLDLCIMVELLWIFLHSLIVSEFDRSDQVNEPGSSSCPHLGLTCGTGPHQNLENNHTHQ